jgi:hypothetical protein
VEECGFYSSILDIRSPLNEVLKSGQNESVDYENLTEFLLVIGSTGTE